MNRRELEQAAISAADRGVTPRLTFLLDMKVEYAIIFTRRSWRHA